MIRASLAAVLLLLGGSGAAVAQQLGPADSALVRRILVAEDAREGASPVFAEGLAHPDDRIRALARRAQWRVGDTLFSARDSLPPVPAPPVWPEPAWKPRYRALVAGRDDCALLRRALTDSAWPVRLRAMDVARASCASDDSIGRALRAWVDALPGDASRRGAGNVSWHGAAHGVVALARLRPSDARPRVRRLATHRQWQVRAYAARAAAVLSDTGTLRALARDPDDNVKEAAIEALSKLTGHTDDDLYLAALNASGAQAVRAAAMALKGSPRADVAGALNAAYDRWAARGVASARDARIALLEAAGRARGGGAPRRRRPCGAGAARRNRVDRQRPSPRGARARRGRAAPGDDVARLGRRLVHRPPSG